MTSNLFVLTCSEFCDLHIVKPGGRKNPADLGIISDVKNDVLYQVASLSDCMQDPATLAWLVTADVPLPGMIPEGRYPSPSEIKAVIDAIPGIRAEYLITDKVWQVTVTSRSDVTWARLVMRDYDGDVESIHSFYFEAGWDEIIVLVVSHLARKYGPFVLLHDSGAPPQVVM
jgi:hypothetical protein